MKKYLITLLLALSLLIGIPALASDISTAIWSGTIIISNNSTAANNVATVMTLNTTQMIDLGYMNSSGNNTAMRSAAGADVPYMPGYTPGGYPWAIFVPSIGANTVTNYILYTGGTANMSPKLGIFTDSSGATISDNATLEPSANWSIEIKAFVADLGYLLKKSGAFYIKKNTDNVTAAVANPMAEYSAGASTAGIYDVNWAAQGFYTDNTSGDFYSAVLTLEPFDGASVDDNAIEVAIRAADADGKPTGADLCSGTIDGATITASADYEIIFDTGTTTYTTNTQYTIVVEASSASLAHRLLWGRDTTGSYPGGWNSYSGNSGGTWTNNGAYDQQFQIYANNIVDNDSIVVAQSVSAGEYDIRSWADGVNMYISIDGVQKDSDVVDTIRNDTADWVFSSDVIPYVLEYDHYVGGNNRAKIRWAWGTVLPDLSGNGNAATFLPRTASSDADVSATLASFAPIAEADAPAYTLDDPPNFITTTPGASGNFTAGTMNVTAPGWPVIRQVAIAGAVPERLIATLLSMLGLIMLSFAISAMFRNNNNNNIFIKSAIIFAAMCILAAVGIMDIWQLYFFVILALGIMWMSRQREVY